MNFKLWNRIAATIVFLFSTILFLFTVAPTFSFWDCGEFTTSAITLGVPHPPGAPFFQLVGKVFSWIPFGSDLGYRVNLISTFGSSITVLFTFLIITRLLRIFVGDPKTKIQAIVILLSASIGALCLAFSDTFWFNASESEVYGIGMFVISIVIWIGLEWYTGTGFFKDERALLLVAYLMGLSIGIHLLSLLALFFIFFLIYLRGKEWRDINNLKSISIFVVASGVGFALYYPIVVKYLPQFLAGGTFEIIVTALFIAGLIIITGYLKSYPKVRLVSLSTLLVVIGYSTYILVVMRANDRPALNENDPHDLKALYSYLNREQYGDYPLLKGPNYDNKLQTINRDVQKLFPRRWSPEHTDAYKKYSSDFEYFMEFQLRDIFLRYFAWNFIGRAGDVQEAPVAFIGDAGDWSESYGYPNRYYAIPFILGFIGLIYHFRKDWKTGTATAALFLIMGLGLVVYFNMTEPQVRERDYFFVGAFYVFTIWIGLGVYAIYEYIRHRFQNPNIEKIGLGFVGLLFIIAPLNMLKENYQTHDRHLNYVSFDYAYNLLQSCEQDAILFTGGDNDTFPVWYLQYVAGVRRDVRVVNLSLVNTPWYCFQLKNEQPYGAKKVQINFTNDQIERLSRTDEDAIRETGWNEETKQITVPVPASVFSKFKKEHASSNEASINADSSLTKDGVMQWTEKARYPVRLPDGSTPYIRHWQDIMIEEIIKANNWQRPIYFALTTAQTDRIGLDDNLLVEGLAYILTPFKYPHSNERYYSAVNIEYTKKHLLHQITTPDSNRSNGFMFRNLNNPKVNLDEQSTRMVMSYRVLFMALAQVILQDRKDKKGAGEVLNKMEATLPLSIHKMDITLKTHLIYMYYMADQKDKLFKLSDDVEKFFLAQLAKDISGRSAPQDPYGVLLNIYQFKGEYSKGADLLKRMKAAFPDEQGIDPQIAQWEQMAKGLIKSDSIK